MLSDVMCSYCLRSRAEAGPMVCSPLAAICRACAENAVRLHASDISSDALTTPVADLDDSALLSRIADVAAAGGQVEEHLAAWVTVARNKHLSWERIGEALGITRQSAWERFASKTRG
ncbi:MAG: ClpX C4-type zinc finger protein [Arachnia sp.]